MQRQVKSVIPIYGTGGIFFLYAILLPMYRIGDLAIGFVVSIIGFPILEKIFPGVIEEIEITYSHTGDKAADQILSQGREYIERLAQLKDSIQDEEISRRIANLQKISRQIFDYISKNPGQMRKINTFMDYYYPTALKFIESYAEYDNKAVKGENIRSTLEKIRASIARFEEAFNHQLNNLYSDKALDIETDIAVLDDIMKKEGL